MSVGSSTSSASTSTSPISFSGIVSGLNTSSIIQKLLQVQQIPITNLQNQITNIQTQQQALTQLETYTQAFQSSAAALTTPGTFTATAGTSSDTTVATITTTAGAAAGTYGLTVNNLATAQKVSSSAQSDVTSALNLNGTFVVNGHAISVASTDSLTSIAQKVNTGSAGVTASLINGGTGNAYLTFTSSSTGAANAIQMSDLSGGVLNGLGILGSTTSLRQPVPGGGTSFAFGSSTSTVGSLLGLSSPPAGTITLNGGASIAVDFNTDSLQSIADKINGSGGTATASVVQVSNNGTTSYQLQLTSSGSPLTYTDPNNLLNAIGVLQNKPGTQLVAAQDASYSLDNVALTSASNTITTAIPGATLNLLKGTNSAPGTSTLSLSTNTTGIDQNVSSFVTNYNTVVDYIAQQSQLNPSTFQTGPLFGDFTTEQVQSTLSTSLFANVTGLSGKYTNLASLGFSLDSSNHLVVDQTALNTAVTSNPTAVANVFASSGTSTNSNLTFVSSTSKSIAGANPYPVNITQLATQGNYTGELAQTTANPSSEILTFGGALFSSTPYKLTLDVNSTLASTIDKINSDATLKGVVTASNNGGKLEISSQKYGANGNFSVVSNLEAATNNSGIGVGSLGTTVAGVDVAGTINGEAATGNGQYLTGSSGNKTTDGLQIRYGGTTLGAVGSMTFSKGVASVLNDAVTNLTDPVAGVFTADNNAFTQQITDINQQITDLQTQVNAQQTYLQNQFTNMESAIAALQQQQSQLNSILGVTNSNTSSSTTGTNATIG